MTPDESFVWNFAREHILYNNEGDLKSPSLREVE